MLEQVEKLEKEPKEIPQIVQLVNANDVIGIEEALLSGKCKTEDLDENGMTALQHAAYKGQFEMCKLLLDYGADVNIDCHDHGYSTLHFAALSGNADVVTLVLSSGAKTHSTNSLKRTASQIAAFVGNHHISALINNFLPLESLMYYTVPQGLEKEPKLPLEIAIPLHNFIMQSNLHPVFLAMTLGKSHLLAKAENISKAANVVCLLCEKEISNEVMCLKLHYIGYILKTLQKEIDKLASSVKKESVDNSGEKLLFESIIKKWLIGRPKDGFEEYLEYYIRDAIKAFPHVEMPLYLQLVRNVATEIGESCAVDMLHSAINGQKGFNDHVVCSACGTELKEAKKCAQCKSAQYCDKTCQKLQWHTHKKFCKVLAEKYLNKN